MFPHPVQRRGAICCGVCGVIMHNAFRIVKRKMHYFFSPAYAGAALIRKTPPVRRGVVGKFADDNVYGDRLEKLFDEIQVQLFGEDAFVDMPENAVFDKRSEVVHVFIRERVIVVLEEVHRADQRRPLIALGERMVAAKRADEGGPQISEPPLIIVYP